LINIHPQQFISLCLKSRIGHTDRVVSLWNLKLLCRGWECVKCSRNEKPQNGCPQPSGTTCPVPACLVSPTLMVAACVPCTTEASYTAEIDIPIRAPARTTTPILDTRRPFGAAPHTSHFSRPSAPCKDQSASTDEESEGGGENEQRTNIARSIPWDSNPRVLDCASSSPRALAPVAPEPYRSRVRRLRAPCCGQERLAPVGRPRICFVARW